MSPRRVLTVSLQIARDLAKSASLATAMVVVLEGLGYVTRVLAAISLLAILGQVQLGDPGDPGGSGFSELLTPIRATVAFLVLAIGSEICRYLSMRAKFGIARFYERRYRGMVATAVLGAPASLPKKVLGAMIGKAPAVGGRAAGAITEAMASVPLVVLSTGMLIWLDPMLFGVAIAALLLSVPAYLIVLRKGVDSTVKRTESQIEFGRRRAEYLRNHPGLPPDAASDHVSIESEIHAGPGDRMLGELFRLRITTANAQLVAGVSHVLSCGVLLIYFVSVLDRTEDLANLLPRIAVLGFLFSSLRGSMSAISKLHILVPRMADAISLLQGEMKWDSEPSTAEPAFDDDSIFDESS